MKRDLEPAERKLHAAMPDEQCTCQVCVIPRRLYEAWRIIHEARFAARTTRCDSNGIPACRCPSCELRAAVKAFDDVGRAEHERKVVTAELKHRRLGVQLHEGMTAASARAHGVEVPRQVPDGATLRFRSQRTKAHPRPTLADIDVVDIASETRVVESVWTWAWRMALDVGARGVPDERGIDYPCEECGALAGNTVERGFQRCRTCGYPSQ